MHDSLANMLQTNFAMMQHHKYSFSDLESMLPWERRVYMDMLVEHVKEENEKYEKDSGGPRFDPAQFKQ